MSTKLQSAFCEFMDMFNGFVVFDKIKNKQVIKSEIFSFLYRETWTEQCLQKNISSTASEEHVEANINYDLLRKKINAAFNNHYSRYSVSEKTYNYTKKPINY